MARLTGKKLQSLKEDLRQYPMPTDLDIKKAEVAAIASKDLNDFAEFLGVDLVTIKVWAKRSKAFWNAINSWETVETFNIKKNLAKRANGFTKTTSRDVITKAGLVETLRVETYYPPSETAAQFWLKNKAADEFQDKKEIDVNVNANIRAWLVAAGPMDPSEILDVEPIRAIESAITEAVFTELYDGQSQLEAEMLNSIIEDEKELISVNNDLTINDAPNNTPTFNNNDGEAFKNRGQFKWQ